MIRNTDEVRTLNDLRIAIDLRRPVTIDYVKADGTRTVRVIEPYEIAGPDDRKIVRAMDRQSRDVRAWRIDRLYAYRVAPARGRFAVPRPMGRTVLPEPSKPVTAARFDPGTVVDDLDAEWADWQELTYDPDAPVPYLTTDKEI
jgi:predicted DNA-binding transcriptional regulator YafY